MQRRSEPRGAAPSTPLELTQPQNVSAFNYMFSGNSQILIKTSTKSRINLFKSIDENQSGLCLNSEKNMVRVAHGFSAELL